MSRPVSSQDNANLPDDVPCFEKTREGATGIFVQVEPQSISGMESVINITDSSGSFETPEPAGKMQRPEKVHRPAPQRVSRYAPPTQLRRLGKAQNPKTMQTWSLWHPRFQPDQVCPWRPRRHNCCSPRRDCRKRTSSERPTKKPSETACRPSCKSLRQMHK